MALLSLDYGKCQTTEAEKSSYKLINQIRNNEGSLLFHERVSQSIDTLVDHELMTLMAPISSKRIFRDAIIWMDSSDSKDREKMSSPRHLLVWIHLVFDRTCTYYKYAVKFEKFEKFEINLISQHSFSLSNHRSHTQTNTKTAWNRNKNLRKLLSFLMKMCVPFRIKTQWPMTISNCNELFWVVLSIRHFCLRNGTHTMLHYAAHAHTHAQI